MRARETRRGRGRRREKMKPERRNGKEGLRGRVSLVARPPPRFYLLASPPPSSPPPPSPFSTPSPPHRPPPNTHTFLFFSSALCLFLCLLRGKVLLWYDVAPELLCPFPYAAPSPTEVACCCELLLTASPGLLAGLGLRLSGVTDRRSPVELRLEYMCVCVCICIMYTKGVQYMYTCIYMYNLTGSEEETSSNTSYSTLFKIDPWNSKSTCT